MANQFLIKSTMADLRTLSSDEIISLQGNNPVYKGVELLGYYEMGDTPSPIHYYISDTNEEDDGGSHKFSYSSDSRLTTSNLQSSLPPTYLDVLCFMY